MKTIQQENADKFHFWKNSFAPRTDKWKRETLARLNKGQSIFETEDDRAHKINALESLLGL